MRISDWSSDVCSSDLVLDLRGFGDLDRQHLGRQVVRGQHDADRADEIAVIEQRRRPVDRHVDCEAAVAQLRRGAEDRKRVVEGKSESVRVDLGGRRILKKKKGYQQNKSHTTLIATRHNLV